MILHARIIDVLKLCGFFFWAKQMNSQAKCAGIMKAKLCTEDEDIHYELSVDHLVMVFVEIILKRCVFVLDTCHL